MAEADQMPFLVNEGLICIAAVLIERTTDGTKARDRCIDGNEGSRGVVAGRRSDAGADHAVVFVRAAVGATNESEIGRSRAGRQRETDIAFRRPEGQTGHKRGLFRSGPVGSGVEEVGYGAARRANRRAAPFMNLTCAVVSSRGGAVPCPVTRAGNMARRIDARNEGYFRVRSRGARREA